MKPLLQVTNAEEQKREMEEEIKRLNDRHDKLKFEMEDLNKKYAQVRLGCYMYVYFLLSLSPLFLSLLLYELLPSLLSSSLSLYELISPSSLSC